MRRLAADRDPKDPSRHFALLVGPCGCLLSGSSCFKGVPYPSVVGSPAKRRHLPAMSKAYFDTQNDLRHLFRPDHGCGSEKAVLTAQNPMICQAISEPFPGERLIRLRSAMSASLRHQPAGMRKYRPLAEHRFSRPQPHRERDENEVMWKRSGSRRPALRPSSVVCGSGKCGD